MRHSHALLLALLAFAALSAPIRAAAESSDEESEVEEPVTHGGVERGILVSHKSLDNDWPIEGREVAVTISMHNAGSLNAVDVDVFDAEWPEDQFKVRGETQAHFDFVAPGTTVTHTYHVRTMAAKFYQHPPAKIAYTPIEGNPASRTDSQTPTMPVRTVTMAEHLRRKALTAGSFLTLGAVSSVSGWRWVVGAGLLAVLLRVGLKAKTAASRSAADRRRTEALKALQAFDKQK